MRPSSESATGRRRRRPVIGLRFSDGRGRSGRSGRCRCRARPTSSARSLRAASAPPPGRGRPPDRSFRASPNRIGPRLAPRPEDRGDHPRAGRPDRAPPQEAGPADRLRHRSERTLQRPQRRRTMLQPPQAVARHRDALGQTRPQLPSRRQPRRGADLDQDRSPLSASRSCSVRSSCPTVGAPAKPRSVR